MHLRNLCSGIYACLRRDFGRIEPQRGIEYLTTEVVESCLLPFGRHQFVGHFTWHVIDITTADVLGNMPEVAGELLPCAVVHLAQIVVLVVGLACPLWQVRDNPLKVLHTIITSLHVIVAKVFTLCSRIFVGAFSTEPKTGIFG